MATPTPSPPTPEEKRVQSIKIAQVTLQGGTVDFTDRVVNPNYSAKLTKLGGRISELTSEEGKPADVDLHTTLEGIAPLEITGKVLTHIEVTDDDLQELAKRRAQAVREYLLTVGQIDAGRILLVAPKAIVLDTQGEGRGSRVVFTIK